MKDIMIPLKKFMVLSACVFLAGCGRADKANGINAAVESGTTNETNDTANETETENKESETETGSVAGDTKVDYDLSVMGSDMVYATVYQLMVEPATYIGKSFKITGNYYSSYSKELGIYYHFCMIKDAAACCAQGIELLWADEKMNRHENCPEEESRVTVEGVFETYKEGPNTYGRLKDARIVEE